MTINIIGDFFGTSGYAIHTRQLANALSKFTKVRLSINLTQNWQADVNDKELEMIKRPFEEDEINLIITMPQSWKFYTKNERNWAYCVWEGDKVPKSFIEEFLNPDIEYILVPSEHTRKAIVNTEGYRVEILDKLVVIPHGVNLDLFYPKTKPETFTFICNKGFRNLEDRGGIQYFIQAYLSEFTKEDNVEAVIKLNLAYPLLDINNYLKGLMNENSPKLTLVPQNIPYNKMVEIYNKGHVFVSPSRSDAFNIPCLEAMACGLPVITTDFGGQTDFVNDKNGWIISGKIEEIQRSMDDYIYEGIKWLTPDITQLRKALRNAFENYPNGLDGKEFTALNTARNMTWDNSAKEVLKLVGQTNKQ